MDTEKYTKKARGLSLLSGGLDSQLAVCILREAGAEVLGIGFVDDREIAKYTTETVRIPRVDPFIAPILAVIPMQLLAYYTSIKRGNDVDKPRNLAKSVTVE